MTQGRQVHLYFTYGSSYAALAWWRITRFHPERYAGVEVLWKPVQFGRLMEFQGHDGKSPRNLDPYARHDVARWAQHYGAPLRYPACYPIDSSNASRAHLLAEMEGPAMERAWMQACFEAYWVHGQDVSQPDVLDRLALGLGMAKVSDRLGSQGIQRLLDANTHEAVQSGAPGVPFAAFGGQGFWGNDRLAWLERALGAGDALD